MRGWRSSTWMLRLIAACLVSLAACGGGGGGGDGGGGTTSGLTTNFIQDSIPSCPGSPDSVGLRRVSSLGNLLTLGLQVTDCDASLEIYGTTFEIDFDAAVLQCASANPCANGTILTQPLLTGVPQCTCDNNAGHLLGVFSRKAPGTNQSVPGGAADIVLITLRARAAGTSPVDLLNTGSKNGTSLVALNPASPGDPPSEIAGLTYISGDASAQ